MLFIYKRQYRTCDDVTVLSGSYLRVVYKVIQDG